MKTKIAVLTGILIATQVAQATSTANFYSGACSSKGDVTRDALTQASVIEKAITDLRDDPNCKGIESIVQNLQVGSTSAAKDTSYNDVATRMLELPQEIRDLRSFIGGDDAFRNKVWQLLINRTVEDATLATQVVSSNIKTTPEIVKASLNDLTDRAGMTIDTTINGLNRAMQTLPNFELCLQNKPDQVLAIFGAMVKISAALVTNGEGVTSRFGSMIGNLVSFMRNKTFAKMLKKINESEFWISMSCLIETTSQAYCSAQDNYELLKFQQQEYDIENDFNSSESNPLEGYYLLVREIPSISEWLQKVQFGVNPKLTMDANFKNVTLDSLNDLLKSANNIRGYFSEQKMLYSQMNDVSAKRNFIFTLLQKVMNTMYSEGPHSSAAINFFAMSVPEYKAPFAVLGMDIPEDLIPKDKVVPQWEDWMQGNLDNDTKFQAMGDPDTLIEKMGTNLNSLIDQAYAKASDYYRQRMILDTANLVNESLTNPNPMLTVVSSLQHVDSYLKKLINRYSARRTTSAQTLVPSLRDTSFRINQILSTYAEVDQAEQWRQQQLSAPMIYKFDMNELDLKYQQKITAAYSDIIASAFNGFNVMLQRDTFLMNRIATFVMYDYSDRVASSENMSDYQQKLMIVTGKTLMTKLTSINGVNPVTAQLDLNSAQMVNKRNLQAVEMLLSDSLLNAISEMNKVSGGKILEDDPNAPSKYKWYIAGKGAVRMYNPDYIEKLSPKNNAGDDAYGSFAQFKAKLCIQSLAFDDWQKFVPYCQRSNLTSQFRSQATREKLNLDASYDYYTSYKQSDSGKRYGICTLRDYLRKNHVYWLTLTDNFNK